jgi:hypothetical protein
MDGPLARNFQSHVACAKLQYLAREPIVDYVPEANLGRCPKILDVITPGLISGGCKT